MYVGATKGDDAKNLSESIRFGSAVGDACDEIIVLIEKDLHALDGIKINDDMDSNKLTLLFVFAVLRNSLASMLNVVSLMINLQIRLSPSAEPFLRYVDP